MSVRILTGDALAMLGTLPDQSVQCVVTSPPYFQLRDYQVAGQIGMEQTPAAFLDALYAVFDEVKRVLRDDGCVFVNIGDSYAGSGKGPTGGNGIGDQETRQGFTGGRGKTTSLKWGDDPTHANSQQRAGGVQGIRPKSLMLIPERFAIGMADRGWIVRSQIVWAKKSAMPESVRDRPTSAWEPIWMFTKSASYFWDQDAVRQPLADSSAGRYAYAFGGAKSEHLKDTGAVRTRPVGERTEPASANLRNVWHLSPEPSRDEHYAAYPTEIPRRCILAATSEKGQCPACGAPWIRRVERGALVKVNPNNGNTKPYGHGKDTRADQTSVRSAGMEARGHIPGHAYERTATGWEPSCKCDAGAPVPQTVLDCFGGSGTTGVVADRLGRDAILIELSPTYAAMARRRIEGDAPMFAEVEIA